MDFFGSQDDARRRTSLLVFYYLLAILLIVASVYLAFAIAFAGAGGASDPPSGWWHPRMFAWVSTSTLLLILGGSAYKISLLASGGSSVAEMLGGTRIDRNTGDHDERKVLNVVEEMAIAAGTPVPPVYILEESGINAFAAGFTTRDAVIGITRGCITSLTRDELQGVAAHEFSHILNGDMRLNIRLLGVLHGILLIALVGTMLLRGAAYSSSSRHSRSGSRSKGGGAQAAILVMGLFLVIIGYIGVFFANLIKSAVSRQREFLADASAVQFTRNPHGIANALKKIGALAGGSVVKAPHASETSHLFFASALSGGLAGLLATHPPLLERIRRLDPAFSGDFAKAAPPAPAPVPAQHGIPFTGQAGISRLAVDSNDIISSVGTIDSAHMEYASQLMQSLPDTIASECRNPSGAQTVIFLMLLSGNDSIAKAQLDIIKDTGGRELYSGLLELIAGGATLPPTQRLAAAMLAIPSLKEIPGDRIERFKSVMEQLATADNEIDLFEYTLSRMIRRHLGDIGGKPSSSKILHRDMSGLLQDAALLLSCLAHWGNDNPEKAELAFEAGSAKLEVSTRLSIIPPGKCGLHALDSTLTKLSSSSPAIRKKLLVACIACVGHDGFVTTEEAELLRAVADAFDCPMPPILPGRRPGVMNPPDQPGEIPLS